MKASLLWLLIFVALCSICKGEQQEEEDWTPSPKCASALLASTILGYAATTAFLPRALCTAGFCSIGVSGGSYASWWQSTMGSVAKGSTFAWLQSIAMNDAAAASATTAVKAGGALFFGAMGLEFCSFVDETDPDSAMGIAFTKNHDAVTTAIQTKQMAVEICASSETCTAVSETAEKVASAASGAVQSLWNSVTSAVSTAAGYTKLQFEILRLEREKRETIQDFGVRSFELIRKFGVKERVMVLILPTEGYSW